MDFSPSIQARIQENEPFPTPALTYHGLHISQLLL